jgi:ankyrin repeat protein
MASIVQRPRSSSLDAEIWKTVCEEDRDQELERSLSQYAGDISLIHDECGNTLLHLAAKLGSLKCVKLLLNHGGRTDVKNADLDTPLHFAANLRSSECLKALLDAEDKVCERNRSQNTPLHSAAEACCAESIKLLIDHISRRSSLDLEREINSTNSSMRNPLHLCSQSGSLECIKLLVENKSALSMADESGNNPLHYAAMSGSPDAVKYLMSNGADLVLQNKDKYTALHMVLNNFPNGEDLLKEVLDKCVEVISLKDGKETLQMSLKILCPKSKNKMAVANRLYTSYRHKKKLLLHPLLKTLIRLEWKKSKYVMWYRFSTYLLYLLALTVFVYLPPDSTLSVMFRILTGFLSVHVAFFCFPYLLPGQYSWNRRITKTLLTVVPPMLTLVSVSIPYNPEWCGVSFLLSWLSTPLYSSSIYIISQQTGMFVFITNQILEHSLVLLFVLVGFSMTFYVLYHEKSSENFSNFWYSFLYTTLVLLQGDGIGDSAMFGGNTTDNTTDGEGYISYITEALFNMRFASIIASLLFVFLVIIALLNMLVALAIRGGDELMDYGQVYHLWGQAQLLYEWHEVKRFCSKFHITQTYYKFRGYDYITIGDGDVPMSLRQELSTVAKYKSRKKESELAVAAMEKVVEDLSRFLYEMKDMRESLMTALKTK